MKFGRRAFWINVVGFRYPNSDGSSRTKYLLQLTKDDKLKLIPEPENPYDKYAIKVVYGDNFQIGYIPREYSKLISEYLESNYHYDIPNFLLEKDDVGYWLKCGIRLIMTPPF